MSRAVLGERDLPVLVARPRAGTPPEHHPGPSQVLLAGGDGEREALRGFAPAGRATRGPGDSPARALSSSPPRQGRYSSCHSRPPSQAFTLFLLSGPCRGGRFVLLGSYLTLDVPLQLQQTLAQPGAPDALPGILPMCSLGSWKSSRTPSQRLAECLVAPRAPQKAHLLKVIERSTA